MMMIIIIKKRHIILKAFLPPSSSKVKTAVQEDARGISSANKFMERRSECLQYGSAHRARTHYIIRGQECGKTSTLEALLAANGPFLPGFHYFIHILNYNALVL